MAFVFQLVTVTVLALGLGFWSAFYAVERGIGFEAIKRGSWVSWAQAGLPDADPYTRATFARSGELPLVGGQSITFSASGDDAGEALRRECTYRVFGKAPPGAMVDAGRLRRNHARGRREPLQPPRHLQQRGDLPA